MIKFALFQSNITNERIRERSAELNVKAALGSLISGMALSIISLALFLTREKEVTHFYQDTSPELVSIAWASMIATTYLFVKGMIACLRKPMHPPYQYSIEKEGSYLTGLWEGLKESVDTLLITLSLHQLAASLKIDNNPVLFPIMVFMSWHISVLLPFIATRGNATVPFIPEKIAKNLSRAAIDAKPEYSISLPENKKAARLDIMLPYLKEIRTTYLLGKFNFVSVAQFGMIGIAFLLNGLGVYDAQTGATSGSQQENIKNVSMMVLIFSSMIMLKNLWNVAWYQSMDNHRDFRVENLRAKFQPAAASNADNRAGCCDRFFSRRRGYVEVNNNPSASSSVSLMIR